MTKYEEWHFRDMLCLKEMIFEKWKTSEQQSLVNYKKDDFKIPNTFRMSVNKYFIIQYIGRFL
jgi:hypothetical protein